MSEVSRCDYCTKIIEDLIYDSCLSDWGKYCDKQCFFWDREDRLFLENKTQLKLERIARIKFGWTYHDVELDYWSDKSGERICWEDDILKREEFKPYLEVEKDAK